MIHNERIKLLAGALNALGLAFAIGGFVGPTISGKLMSGTGVIAVAYLAFGAILHLSAHVVLGRSRSRPVNMFGHGLSGRALWHFSPLLVESG